MQQLRYADEVRDFAEVPIGQAEVKAPELKLAVQLVDQIATDSFNPAEYEDEVRKRTRELIDLKVAGQEITAPVPDAPKAQIIDLMEALKASLAGQEPAGAGRKPPKPSSRKTAAEAAGDLKPEPETERAVAVAAAAKPRAARAKAAAKR